MTIKARIAKLQEKMKPIEEEIERKKEELKSKEEHFKILNQVMKEHYPGHKWCKLPSKERHRLYFSKPAGTYQKTDSPLPIFVFNKKENKLIIEVHRLYCDILQQEILRRRREKNISKISKI